MLLQKTRKLLKKKQQQLHTMQFSTRDFKNLNETGFRRINSTLHNSNEVSGLMLST